MLKIPKIIHQVYDYRDGRNIPKQLLEISSTWKVNQPDWEYNFWDHHKIDAFLKEYYPHYNSRYFRFKFPVQRWDSIRYLIVYHYGGMYVDMDYESLEPIEGLLADAECFFGSEPEDHKPAGMSVYLGNSFFGSRRHHPFLQLLVNRCFESPVKTFESDKMRYVLETTGPGMVSKMYNSLADKSNIRILPAEYVAPWSLNEARLMVSGRYTSKMEEKLEKAYCVHYFFGSWLEKENVKP